MTSNTIRNLVVTCGLIVMFLPFNANAQIVSSSNELSSPAYDMNKEIKIEGTIEKIETNTSRGLIGTHLFVMAPEGIVDVHLGASMAVSGKNLGLAVGESINLTGMMANVSGSAVLLARILTTSSHIYMLRNERGAPVRSLMPRGASSSATMQKGAL